MSRRRTRRKADKMFWLIFTVWFLMTAGNIYVMSQFNRFLVLLKHEYEEERRRIQTLKEFYQVPSKT